MLLGLHRFKVIPRHHPQVELKVVQQGYSVLHYEKLPAHPAVQSLLHIVSSQNVVLRENGTFT